MRTDRRGPLVAFVVVAIIAAILLVTSVRSQAAPGWLRVPATTIADGPTAEGVLGLGLCGAPDRASRAPAVHRVHRVQPQVPVPALVVPAVPVTASVAPSRHRVARTPAPASRTRTAAVIIVPGHQGHGRHLGRQGHDQGRHLGWTRAVVVRG